MGLSRSTAVTSERSIVTRVAKTRSRLASAITQMLAKSTSRIFSASSQRTSGTFANETWVGFVTLGLTPLAA